MFDFLKSLFSKDEDGPEEHYGSDNIPLAAAALLVEAAIMDDALEAVEQQKIIQLLTKNFELSQPEAYQILQQAHELAQDRNIFYHATKTIKDNLEEAERLQIMEMLWEVVYSDEVVHDHESNLMRRLAGLLYISDQKNGEIRRKVRSKLGLSE